MQLGDVPYHTASVLVAALSNATADHVKNAVVDRKNRELRLRTSSTFFQASFTMKMSIDMQAPIDDTTPYLISLGSMMHQKSIYIFLNLPANSKCLPLERCKYFH